MPLVLASALGSFVVVDRQRVAEASQVVQAEVPLLRELVGLQMALLREHADAEVRASVEAMGVNKELA